MKAGLAAVFGALAAFLLTGCDENDNSPVGPNLDFIEQFDGREALALANEWRVSKPDVISRLTALAVTFAFPEGHELSVPLPEDTMVIAIAPYINATHPCAIHSISGCSGELADVDTRVLAEDQDGTVLMDETLRTMGNGFIELWLPRDSEIDLTLESQGKKATGKITTYETSNTCMTTFKLE